MVPKDQKNIEFVLENAWLRMGDFSQEPWYKELVHNGTNNPLIIRNQKDRDNPALHLLRVMRDKNYLSYAAKVLLDVDLLPEQCAILGELWERPFPMLIASRGFGKSYMLALYALLRCALVPGTKVVIVGAAFRQSKVIFEYMESLWLNAPILRSVCDNGSGPRRDVDRCTMKVNDSIAIAIPLGDGTKIRGLRAHIIISDEFSSIPPDIYETVVAGFAVVTATPVLNVKESARRDISKELGIWTPELEDRFRTKKGNQAIIAGTAGYDFNHFADYWRKYNAIIRSGGDPEKKIRIPGMNEIITLQEIFNQDRDTEVNLSEFNHKDYSIIRIPYELIPKGFMDDKHVTRAKATIHSGTYQMEYGCCFTKDSDGFFKRTLIESCVASDRKPVNLPSGPVWFDALTRGVSTRKYIFGIDPASEADNFSIVVLELHSDHTRVVYTWTTNRNDFKQRVKAKMTDAVDFYSFCARKIRDLMAVFPPEKIGIDAQGGGIAIEEALHDTSKLKKGELPLWPIIDPDNKKQNKEIQLWDTFPGLHILEMIQFAKYEWTTEANHGLRKDLEDKVLLFPRFDTLTLALSAEEDGRAVESGDKSRLYDSLEDAVMEIEELKNELSTIVVTRTGTGVNSRDRWDTPEIKLENGRKGRLRKDRYSALVIANMLARQIKRAVPLPDYTLIGGVTRDIQGKVPGKLYNGPDWYVKGMENIHKGTSRKF